MKSLSHFINHAGQPKRLIAGILTAALTLGLLVGCSDKPVNNKTEGSSATDEKSLTAVRKALVLEREIQGLGALTGIELYVNGQRSPKEDLLKPQDNKKFYLTATGKRFVNYTDGYRLDLPTDWAPDFSLSSYRVRFDTPTDHLTISKETSIYADVNQFISECILRTVLSDQYRQNNHVTLLEPETTVTIDKFQARVVKCKLEDLPADLPAYYTYVVLYNETGRIYRLMFKSTKTTDFVETVAKSFVGQVPQGAAVDSITYPKKANPKWDTATKAYYDKLQNSDQIDWGIFTARIESTGVRLTIPRMEQNLNYSFPIISQYVHFGSGSTIGIDFPTAFAQKIDEQGKVLQLTYQFTTDNNESLTTYTPCLDIYRGKEDEVLRKFAKQVADFGKPVLFRLNNEMNTDWTSYSGLANMGDPDIYIETWKRMYNIFQQEGATNTIWIFNSFDGTFPPCKWNNWRCYFPPTDYVQLLGITGYNSGNYYSYESWRDFETIYDGIEKDFGPGFSDWAWIISEFGCSGNGGDKAKWITSMFDCFARKKYPNIKAAVWFNAADYDPATGGISRCFWLDETDESLAAFRDGLAKTQKQKS